MMTTDLSPTIWDAVEIDFRPSTTVVEASAGTGKTTLIAAVATRAIADGAHTIDELMLVTFGRRATTELRSRVHRRFTETIADLELTLQVQANSSLIMNPPFDRTAAYLRSGSEADIQARIDRLRAALATFDRAIIATTHEFCQTMLNALGLLTDHDPSAVFTEDLGQLESQVFTDTYLNLYKDDTNPRLKSFTARNMSKGVLRSTDPVRSNVRDTDRVAFAERLRENFTTRKQLAGVYGFDDMVVRLRDAVSGNSASAQAACELLSSRFKLVLIDEYQDTDTAQWDIVRSAFHNRSQLILIGDPKQAIYAFRGADVQAYLNAVSVAGEHQSLGTNYRSNDALITGIDALFGGAALGDPRISVKPVMAHPHAPQLAGEVAVQLRVIAPPHGETTHEYSEALKLVDTDIADEVRRLLRTGPRGLRLFQNGRWIERQLKPSDIAILVRSNKRGINIHDHLIRSGIPAVFPGATSVFASSAASDWLVLLQAIDNPDAKNIRRAAVTDLLGFTALSLSTASEQSVAELALQIRALGRAFETRGFFAAFELLRSNTDLDRRILASHDGERLLTDIRHLAEVLHEQTLRSDLGVAELAAWLKSNIDEAEASADERMRRLESDRTAVQVMTLHRAKGLEFPVILLPDGALSGGMPRKDGEPCPYHEDGQRLLDVSNFTSPKVHLSQERDEQDEELRTLYVGMTRAQAALKLWWVPTFAAKDSPLQRLLLGNEGAGQIPRRSIDCDDMTTYDIVQTWAHRISVEEVKTRHLSALPSLFLDGPANLRARDWTRSIDHAWTRTSYSGLTVDAHEIPVSGLRLEDDEPDLESIEGDDADDVVEIAEVEIDHLSELTPLVGGAQFGTLVHAILERADLSATDLAAELTRAAAPLWARLPVADVDQPALLKGLERVALTPLGPLSGGRRLHDLPPSHILDEMDFEFSMGAEHGIRRVADLAALLSDPALVPATDPLAGYGRVLAASPAAERTLRGFLNGSIDAVLRIDGDGARPAADDARYVVVDYKTNRLPVEAGRELHATNYTAPAMAEAMIAAHYPLQALLYCVALHRMLAMRLPGYQPEKHLGGVGYLFVRGMAGAAAAAPPASDEGMPLGVFTWYPSAELVVKASEVIGGQR